MTDPKLIEHIKQAAGRMRKDMIELTYKGGANGAHIAPGLSITEIMATLYLGVMRDPAASDEVTGRDVFVLSKGHGALGYYTALHEVGIISREQLYTYEDNGGSFPGQPSKNRALGIDYSGGSLGLGLSYGIGVALCNRFKGSDGRVYVLMGDGECNEGTVWESVMFAAYQKVDNITAIVDCNGMQSDGNTCDILSYDIPAVWKAWGWHVIECDGHDVAALLSAFGQRRQDMPNVILAKTIKGCGVSFMENDKAWHHSRLTDAQRDEALVQLCEKAGE